MTNRERTRRFAATAEPVVATLLDERGHVLADCELEPGPFTREITVRRVLRGHGILLTHHFGSGGGRATLQFQGQLVPVRLVTHWKGHHRVWRLIPVSQELVRTG